MRVTVVPPDRTIICDGVIALIKPWPFEDSEIHAIQWYDTEGEVEYATIPRRPNQQLTDDSLLQPYLAAFNNAVNPDSEPS